MPNSTLTRNTQVKIITPKRVKKIMECVRIDEEDSEDQ